MDDTSSGISFSAARLDAPPAGSAYQLWLLTLEAATSIGTLPASAGGRTLATFAPAAPLPRPIVGARVTIEPAGGSRTPTGSVYLRTAVTPRPSPGSPPGQPATQ